MIKTREGEVHADPPAWIFPVQARDSNYITLKQIQIIDTLVAKFRKAHDATPQHHNFKTPGQASPNPSNFGDTWKYLCSSVASSWKPGRQHLSTHGYTVMEQPVARNLFQSLAAGIMLVEPQQSDNSLCSHPVSLQDKPIGNYFPQTPKKTDFGSKLEAKI